MNFTDAKTEAQIYPKVYKGRIGRLMVKRSQAFITLTYRSLQVLFEKGDICSL
jgi:hypothetical protein